MSEPKPKNNSIYTTGTGVWIKAANGIWWPGIVVDPITIPKDLLEYVKEVKPLAVVKCEQENKFQVVGKNDPIFLYTCDQKMEYVEKGYSLYKSQKKGLPIIGQYDMKNFKKDVVLLESLTGGDMNIFENIDQKQEEVKAAKQCLTPNQPILVSIPKTAPKQRKARRTSSSTYRCSEQVDCKYSTHFYTDVKQHILALHKHTLSIKTEDHAIVEENTNDREIVSNNVEVNQSNGTTTDKDMGIKISSSLDSTSNKKDCEENTPEEIAGLPTTEWMKTLINSGVQEAYDLINKSYCAGTNEIESKNEEASINWKFKYPDTTPKSQIQETAHQNFILLPPVDIFVPISHVPCPTLEELKNNPLTKELQKNMMEHKLLELRINENPT